MFSGKVNGNRHYFLADIYGFLQIIQYLLIYTEIHFGNKSVLFKNRNKLIRIYHGAVLANPTYQSFSTDNFTGFQRHLWLYKSNKLFVFQCCIHLRYYIHLIFCLFTHILIKQKNSSIAFVFGIFAGNICQIKCCRNITLSYIYRTNTTGNNNIALFIKIINLFTESLIKG